MSELTPRQANFCREYVVDFNATQAAIRAGYSILAAKEVGYRLLTNAHVATEVENLQDGVTKRAELTADKVLADIAMVKAKALRPETYDAAIVLRASELEAKYLGILTDKVEHSGTVVTESKFWIEFVPSNDNKELLNVTDQLID